MPKVRGPLLSVDARGRFGFGMIFKKGGIVTRYFKPRNPNTPAQQAQREAFKEFSMPGITKEQADLWYAAINHNHDLLYSLIGHEHAHGALIGLDEDHHLQYLTQGRADLLYAALDHLHDSRYLQDAPSNGGCYLRKDAAWVVNPEHDRSPGRVWFEDDFLFADVTNELIGELHWKATMSSISAVAGTSGNPGKVKFTTGASTNFYGIYPGDGPTVRPIVQSDWTSFMFILALGQSDLTFTARIGVLYNMGQAPTDGCYFEKTTTSVNWFAVTRASSTSTRTDTQVAASTSFVKFQVRKDGSNILFYIDGSLVATNSTNIPAGSTNLIPGVQMQPSSAVTKYFTVDYFNLLLELSR